MDDVLQYNLDKQELAQIRRTLVLLLDEVHNPGSCAHHYPKIDLNELAEVMIYAIDHVLESNNVLEAE